MAYNVEVLPPQGDNNLLLLLLAEQPHLIQEPPPATQLNIDPNDGNNVEQAEDPNDGNNVVEQVEEDVPVGVPFLMNIDPPQVMMMEESPILPFQLQLPEVASQVVIGNYNMLLKLCTLQRYWISSYIHIFCAVIFNILQVLHLSDPEETETEEQSLSSSSDMIEDVDDQVEQLQFR